MKVVDIQTWNRKKIYDHFMQLKDPYFGVVIPFDVTVAYKSAKQQGISFFVKYLHDCLTAVNEVENLRYRLINENVVDCEIIHASATIMRADKTFGFSFINYDENIKVFIANFEKEKSRIQNSDDLFPPVNEQNCIYCSALPWFKFNGHKEPISGDIESVPKLAFSKIEEVNDKLIMNVSINVNHALVDGYHVGLFAEKFQFNLNA